MAPKPERYLLLELKLVIKHSFEIAQKSHTTPAGYRGPIERSININLTLQIL
jgi:hypothetical protein